MMRRIIPIGFRPWLTRTRSGQSRREVNPKFRGGGPDGCSILDGHLLTSAHSPPTGGQHHVTSRYWKHRFHAPLREPRDADDAGTGFLLRRTRRTKERPGHHDAKFRLDGLDDGPVVGFRILALLFGRPEKRHRFSWNCGQPELGGPARDHPLDAIA